MTDHQIKTRFDQIEHLLLSLHHSFLFWSSKTMSLLDDIKAQNVELQAAAVEAKADSARQTTVVTAVVGQLQAMNTQIAALQAQIAAGGTVSDADLQALKDGNTATLQSLSDANVARDAADAALAAGAADNTPA